MFLLNIEFSCKKNLNQSPLIVTNVASLGRLDSPTQGVNQRLSRLRLPWGHGVRLTMETSICEHQTEKHPWLILMNNG